MTDRLLPSVDILTPEFKARIDALNEEYGHEGETLQLYVTPSSEDVTLEQMQETVLTFIRNRRMGIAKVSSDYPEDGISTMTAQEFLND